MTDAGPTFAQYTERIRKADDELRAAVNACKREYKLPSGWKLSLFHEYGEGAFAVYLQQHRNLANSPADDIAEYARLKAAIGAWVDGTGCLPPGTADECTPPPDPAPPVQASHDDCFVRRGTVEHDSYDK